MKETESDNTVPWVAKSRQRKPGVRQFGGRSSSQSGTVASREPLLEYLCQHFDRVGVVALREKLFPEISEDAWLLYCDGFGGCTTEIEWSCHDRFFGARKSLDQSGESR